jgi:glycerol-3-phosphate acyltransferase PlsY
MQVIALVTGWLVGSLPLAVVLGRLISGAEHLSAARERPSRRVPGSSRAA